MQDNILIFSVSTPQMHDLYRNQNRRDVKSQATKINNYFNIAANTLNEKNLNALRIWYIPLIFCSKADNFIKREEHCSCNSLSLHFVRTSLDFYIRTVKMSYINAWYIGMCLINKCSI